MKQRILWCHRQNIENVGVELLWLAHNVGYEFIKKLSMVTIYAN